MLEHYVIKHRNEISDPKLRLNEFNLQKSKHEDGSQETLLYHKYKVGSKITKTSERKISIFLQLLSVIILFTVSVYYYSRHVCLLYTLFMFMVH